jgi:uncharacterized membrane protein
MTSRRGPPVSLRTALGTRIAPPRFVLFLGVLVVAALARHYAQRAGWADALVVGFDFAVLAFTLSLWSLRKDHCAADMRRHAAENDANRRLVLLITVVVSAVLMLAMVAELPNARSGDVMAKVKVIGTLGLGWLFTNLVFMLHYAHMFYGPGDSPETVAGGFEFPATAEPDYWDFLYFAFTAGMSFAASDVDVTSKSVRKVLVLQSLLSFAFNIGALAFCINVLAGAAG